MSIILSLEKDNNLTTSLHTSIAPPCGPGGTFPKETTRIKIILCPIVTPTTPIRAHLVPIPYFGKPLPLSYDPLVPLCSPVPLIRYNYTHSLLFPIIRNIHSPGPLISPPGALVAESILRGRPLTSLPVRFLTALLAVSPSSNSQNPNPLGRPVVGSWINLRINGTLRNDDVMVIFVSHLRLTTGPTSERTAFNCSSVVSNDTLATGNG